MKKMLGKVKNEVLNWTLGILLGATPIYAYHVLGQNDENATRSDSQRTATVQVQEKPVEFVIEKPKESGLENKVAKKSYIDRDVDALARTIVGEAIGELDNPDYLNGFIETVITRAKKKGKSVADTAYEVRVKRFKDKSGKEKERKTWMYSCFDPREGISDKVNNPVKYIGQENWDNCVKIARDTLSGQRKVDESLDNVTNYFVSKGDPLVHRTDAEANRYGIPYWAYQTDENGRLVRDKEGKRIAINPVKIVPVKTGKGYFYKFKNF